ncbi:MULTISPECIES: MGH1-like glycoside hydrolase domain-containing protein [Thermomonosporaceae]|uniref:MGH1-like glycoside hydrolase domain-containing protein n=1 Tax=Thermomonosporaceae TaxID=2012 RepID=UPI00255ADBFE|nr:MULTISPECIES: hypothetical protein [Thermomonosporaceae]MDL4774276.1 hypothetical protein [Actinomadura xylanilytica]
MTPSRETGPPQGTPPPRDTGPSPGAGPIRDPAEIVRRARAVLEAHWDERRGHTYPNTAVFPHQWMWDSCFAAICWHHFGEHARARRELAGVLSAQFADGFVPHMRYAEPNRDRGPLDHCSSYTQPPVYAHAARVLATAGMLPDGLTARIGASLEWLWRHRRTPDGLIYLVHPWESGTDDSPRWDAWVAAFLGRTGGPGGTLRWNRPDWTVFDWHLVDATGFAPNGAATRSTAFECASAGYNVLYAHAAAELGALTGDRAWTERAARHAATIDERLWDDEQGLWADEPITGGEISGGAGTGRVPTLDGVLGALTTRDPVKAERALDQLLDPERFAAPCGLAYVARDHPAYDPDGYWRGTAWMQMNYLAVLAADRWGRADVRAAVTAMSRAAVGPSGFAEHWNPETGRGHGAVPLTWSALVVALAP